jgi:hypothetical protein
LSLTDEIGRFSGTDFERFCAVLLSAHDDTFQAVYGAGGDAGVDGFNVAGDTVFQVYGPKAPPPRSKVKKKIENSIEKFVRLRDNTLRQLQKFVFVTNFDLTKKMHDDLRAMANQAAIAASQSWGLARLARILAEHREIRGLFPETLLPDIVAELRSFQDRQEAALAALGEQQSGNQVYVPLSSSFFVEHVHTDGAPVRSNAFWLASVVAKNLSLDTIGPRDEDALLAAIRSAFPEYEPSVQDRTASHVFLEHRSPALVFHRKWGRWANGRLAMAATLPDPVNGQRYSVEDAGCALARFLRMAGALGVEGHADAYLTFEPSNVSVGETTPLEDVRRPTLTGRAWEFNWWESAVLPDLKAGPELFAARLLVPALREFHGARVEVDALARALLDRLL